MVLPSYQYPGVYSDSRPPTQLIDSPRCFHRQRAPNDSKTIFETGVTCYWWASILRSYVKPDHLPAFYLLLWSPQDNLLMFGDDVKPSEYVTWITSCGAAFLTSGADSFLKPECKRLLFFSVGSLSLSTRCLTCRSGYSALSPMKVSITHGFSGIS